MDIVDGDVEETTDQSPDAPNEDLVSALDKEIISRGGDIYVVSSSVDSQELFIETQEKQNNSSSDIMEASKSKSEGAAPMNLTSVSVPSNSKTVVSVKSPSDEEGMQQLEMEAQVNSGKGEEDLGMQRTDLNTDRQTVVACEDPADNQNADEKLQDASETSMSNICVGEVPTTSPKEEANKCVIEKDADEELEDFFQGSHQKQQPVKKLFPGLDNVDLASDDDSPDMVAENGGEEKEAEEGSMSKTSDCCLKDYPINDGNYKVCRQLGPGVKECIILETGEHIKCVTNKDKPSLCLSSCSILPSQPMSTSSPRPDTGADSPNAPDEDQQASSVSASSANQSDNFEHPPFPDGSSSTIVAADSDMRDTEITARHVEGIMMEGDGSRVNAAVENTEDDIKLRTTAGEESDSVQIIEPIGAVEGESDKSAGDSDEVIGDVLSSGGDGEGGQFSYSKVMKHLKKKQDRQRYLDPNSNLLNDYDQGSNKNDQDTDTQGNDLSLNSRVNTNNNNEYTANSSSQAGLPDVHSAKVLGEVAPPQGLDTNNSANNAGTRHSYRDTQTSSKARSPRGHVSEELSSWSRQPLDDLARDGGYSPSSVLRGSSLTEGTSRYPGLGSHHYLRYDHSPSLEASRLSTRYSRLDRGHHNASLSSGSGQVSWHEMFQLIEDQHRQQQQQQYLEHQRILQEMQDNMAHELNKQQDTLKDRLNKYNTMLEELALDRQEMEQESANLSHTSLEEGEGYGGGDSTSQTTLNGVPISLRQPPPLASQEHHHSYGNKADRFVESTYDRTPVKRSLEKELGSPPRPADTSLTSLQVSLGADKQLKGGVYSSPMPLTRAKPKDSCKSNNNRDGVVQHASNRDRDRDRNRERDRERERERERERAKDRLVSLSTIRDNTSANAAAMASENIELRQRCQDLEDACHDRKTEIREVTQKMQGLERRAADYCQRFETSQSQVLTLRNRLEELTEYAKDRDCLAAEMELKAKKLSESLQSAHKREKELTDSLQAAKVTIRKLVEKYETLEKDHQLLKDSYKDQEESLFASRKDLRDANNKISRLELDQKQLLHEKDLIKHELTMARSSPTRTNFEEALQNVGNHRVSPTRQIGTDPPPRGIERIHHESPMERERGHHKMSSSLSPPDSEESSGTESHPSPIIKAERELQRLRESMAFNGQEEFVPKLQRKFYGTDPARPSNGLSNKGISGPSVSTPSRPAYKTGISLQAPKSSSPRDKKGLRSQTNDMNGRLSAPASSSKRGKIPKDYDMGTTTDHRPAVRSKESAQENCMTGEEAINFVKSGEIISRPAWEDMYTSMAPARSRSSRLSKSDDKKNVSNISDTMRDMSLRERLQSIESLERKYDDMIAEKRKYEAALSRVRGQSQRREKERLESELDRLDRELGSVRMSLKRFHVLKSSI